MVTQSVESVADWIRHRRFRDAQEAERMMKQLNLGKAHDRLQPQQRAAINLVYNIRDSAPPPPSAPAVGGQSAPASVCRSCGGPITPGSRFCTYCGKPLG